MRGGPRTLSRGGLVAAAVCLLFAVGSHVPAVAGMRGRMLHLINNARRSHGEHELRLSDAVSRDAHSHSRQMAKSGYLFHTSSVPALLGNRPWSVWGENIGRGKSVVGTFSQWMRSPEHRANILNRRFRHVGIGIYAKGGWLWSTADFWG